MAELAQQVTGVVLEDLGHGQAGGASPVLVELDVRGVHLCRGGVPGCLAVLQGCGVCGPRSVGLVGDPLGHDPAIGELAAGRTARQQVVAALIVETAIVNSVDFGGGAVAVHSETIGYWITDALSDAGLTITRRR